MAYQAVAYNTITQLIDIIPSFNQALVSSDNPSVTTNLGPITLYTPAAAGCFRVSVYEECLVPGASGGGQLFGSGVFGSGIFNATDSTLQVSVAWTDDVSIRSGTPVATPLDLTATNAASGILFIRSVAGQPITFTAALSNSTSLRYGVFVRLEQL